MSKYILITKQTAGNSDNSNQQLEEKKSSGSPLETRGEVNRYKKLGFLTTKKMVHKFLTCNRRITVEKKCLKYSKGELAEKLGITLEELEKLGAPNSYEGIAAKITLPLVALYCSTKWEKEKCKT